MNITQVIRDLVTGVTIHSLVSKISPTSLDEVAIIDSADSNKLKKILVGNLVTTGIRQTIQTGLKDANGYCAITMTSADLTLTLLASPDEPVSVNAWGGTKSKDRWVEIVANMTLSLPASAAVVYCYINIDENNVPTLGYTLLAPKYQSGGTISTVDGQFTCDISAGKCYVGVAGTSYVQVWRVFFQESVTSASAITSVINYALNGIYESALSSYAASSTTAYPHNIGTQFVKSTPYLKNITTNLGYAVGEEVELGSFGGSATGGGTTSNVDRNTTKITFHSGTMTLADRSTFGYSSITAASWNKFMKVKRSF